MEKITIKKENTLANAPKSKKISFFSAMMIVIGSSVGAGIFLRSQAVLSGSQGSMVLAMMAWVLAALAIIAMALALIEVSSADTKSNLSLIGWCKSFNNRIIYKAAKNFMFYIYLPINYFFLPLYVIVQLQDGIGAFQFIEGGVLQPFQLGVQGKYTDAIIWAVIGLVVSLYFIFISGWSSRIGNIQNMVITTLKFIPLIVAGIIGFIYIGTNGDQLPIYGDNPSGPSAGFLPAPPIIGPISLTSMTPAFGIIIAITGIFFAYDGFYVTAGLQTEMKEPKKTPWAILVGLIMVTIIYLIIAISMSLNGTGSFSGFGTWLAYEGYAWVYGVVNILIAIGILGILNGFAMWAPRFTEDLIKENELPFSSKYLNQLNSTHPKVGIIYSMAITIPIYVLFSVIGIFAYIETPGYDYGLNNGMNSLISFTDIIANWSALFAFAFIVLAIAGCLKNRVTKRIVTQKVSYFKPMAYISIVIITITLVFTIATPILDLFLLSYQPNPDNMDPENIYTQADFTDEIIGRVMRVITLIIFFGLSFGPIIIEDYLRIKKNSKKENYHQVSQ